MDSLRGVAILGVMLCHCGALGYGPSGTGSPATFIVMTMTTGWTALFVYISGFLFEHVSLARFDYGKYLKTKLFNVLAPFAICSAILVLALFGEALVASARDGTLGRETLGTLVTFYGYCLFLGKAGPSLWYIPFATILFVLSPVFAGFAKAPARLRTAALVLTFVLGMTVNRSPDNLDKLQNFSYFLFFYLAGIESSKRRVTFERLLRQPSIAIAAWLCVLALTFITARHGVLEYNVGEWFAWRGLNTDYFHKIALIVAFCSSFLSWPDFVRGPMRSLARDSFGLFFLHNLPLIVIVYRLPEDRGLFATGFPLLDLALGFAVLFGSSWLMVKLVQRGAPGQSRWLIGA